MTAIRRMVPVKRTGKRGFHKALYFHRRSSFQFKLVRNLAGLSNTEIRKTKKNKCTLGEFQFGVDNGAGVWSAPTFLKIKKEVLSKWMEFVAVQCSLISFGLVWIKWTLRMYGSNKTGQFAILQEKQSLFCVKSLPEQSTKCLRTRNSPCPERTLLGNVWSEMVHFMERTIAWRASRGSHFSDIVFHV